MPERRFRKGQHHHDKGGATAAAHGEKGAVLGGHSGNGGGGSNGGGREGAHLAGGGGAGSGKRFFSAFISDYELLSDIGGVDDISYLYLARYVPTKEIVALKYTDLTLSPDYELIEELIRTVRNATLCNHPNILPYFSSFVENERLWTVTLPVHGGSCRILMKSHFEEGFGEAVIASILKEVLRGIIYLHDNHMIHNDVRADNILIDGEGEVRLSGLRQLVSLAQNGEYMKSVFSLVGDNIEWAAPEVMAQNSNFNEKVDVYSFGITAIELAYNKTPFDKWPSLKILLSKLEYDCPAIPSSKPMSPCFFDFVQQCIQKDPSKRPSAKEIADHPFFKMAKGPSYIKSAVIKRIPAPHELNK
ncbi:kinase-like domain-containing protein [Chytridium lagenaria]|nr:kinase-like domain-containing protein [Chytridium lagenaria]